jgi:membrane fusion protein, heavy metal efflux system
MIILRQIVNLFNKRSVYLSLKRVWYFTAAMFVVSACSTGSEVAEQESGLIEITTQQIATDSMQLGQMITMVFENTVKCNGTIVPLPNGFAKVNAPLPGVVTNIYCFSGQSVQKNQNLLEIGGNELIDIQKDLAEASAGYRRIKSEYSRVKTLFSEKVISEKEYIITESEYQTAMARYQGLKMKIEAIGFSVSRIEEGAFYTSYTLKSPITGHISSLKASLGTYIEPHSELVEIINPSMFQLQIAVFASDIANLRKGQTVHFTSVNSTQIQSATISSVGVAIDDNSKSINCYASLTGSAGSNPVANSYVESNIVTGTDTVNALPTEAILKSESTYYILVLSKKENNSYYFNKVEVTPGRQFNNYTEIPGARIEGEILVKGNYNVAL